MEMESRVYVFLWPQYHDSNPSLKGAFLPADYWRLQLQMAKQYADGIVIWGGWGSNGPIKWDENAVWWKVTKDLCKNRDIIILSLLQCSTDTQATWWHGGRGPDRTPGIRGPDAAAVV